MPVKTFRRAFVKPGTHKLDRNFHIIYRIDSRDEIVFVNDDWSDFAVANHASDLVGVKILNRSLWDFISDETTVYLYQEILHRARTGHSMQINFRCDSPSLRRFLELSIVPQANEGVLFDSRVTRTEPRPTQIVFTNKVTRNDKLLIVCSWCKKVDAGKEDWLEVEEAVQLLGLFEVESQPRLSHGMCRPCHYSMSEKLKKLRSS